MRQLDVWLSVSRCLVPVPKAVGFLFCMSLNWNLCHGALMEGTKPRNKTTEREREKKRDRERPAPERHSCKLSSLLEAGDAELE